MTVKQTFFLCGVGGSGMSALARLLVAKGHKVVGSDRSHDHGQTPGLFEQLAREGVTLVPQDGEGVTREMDAVITSTAVDNINPDLAKAVALDVPVKKRAALLAEVFHHAATRIGVAGTSGKSTTTGMVFHILNHASQTPTFINGAAVARGSNMVAGRDDLVVAEIDESDGSIDLFSPTHSVVTNISLDHKSLEELRAHFQSYITRTVTKVILNADCAEIDALQLPSEKTLTFSSQGAAADFRAQDLRCTKDGISFVLQAGAAEVPVALPVLGEHNIANAVSAMSLTTQLGVTLEEAATALATFPGIQRRLQVVRDKNDITIIDDFGHNPDKIRATICALTPLFDRVVIFFQPHGFGPTKLMRQGYIDTFNRFMRATDLVLMPDIYVAPGSEDQVTRDIASEDLLSEITVCKTLHMHTRARFKLWVQDNARAGDAIVVMGARDPSLSELASELLASDRARKSA